MHHRSHNQGHMPPWACLWQGVRPRVGRGGFGLQGMGSASRGFGQIPPPGYYEITVNERAVHILLECILVLTVASNLCPMQK